MKCPKCGYHSFDHLDSCKKCSTDLTDHKAKFNLRGFFSPGQPAAVAPEPVIDAVSDETEPESDGSVDFGFDFLDEEEDPTAVPAKSLDLGDDDQNVSIDQPFGVDSETVPADDLSSSDDDSDDSDDPPGKGPEFAF